jgi:hypothetical protein
LARTIEFDQRGKPGRDARSEVLAVLRFGTTTSLDLHVMTQLPDQPVSMLVEEG